MDKAPPCTQNIHLEHRLEERVEPWTSSADVHSNMRLFSPDESRQLQRKKST
jgi:hypothetical protein